MMKQLPAAAISSNSIIVLQHSSLSSLVFSSRTPVRASFREPIVVKISSRGTGKTNWSRIHYPRRKWVFAAKSAEPDDSQPEGGGNSSSSAANRFLEEILQEGGIML